MWDEDVAMEAHGLHWLNQFFHVQRFGGVERGQLVGRSGGEERHKEQRVHEFENQGIS